MPRGISKLDKLLGLKRKQAEVSNFGAAIQKLKKKRRHVHALLFWFIMFSFPSWTARRCIFSHQNCGRRTAACVFFVAHRKARRSRRRTRVSGHLYSRLRNQIAFPLISIWTRLHNGSELWIASAGDMTPNNPPKWARVMAPPVGGPLYVLPFGFVSGRGAQEMRHDICLTLNVIGSALFRCRQWPRGSSDVPSSSFEDKRSASRFPGGEVWLTTRFCI